MAIFRTQRDRDYTVIPNDIINDSGLSFKAKGVLIYLLSKPEDWSVRRKDIENHGTEGDKAIRTALAELRAAGYVQLAGRERKPDGTLGESIYLVYDKATKKADNKAISPDAHYPRVDYPRVDNAAILNTELLNTELNKRNTDMSRSSANASNEDVSLKEKYRVFIGMFNDRVGSKYRGDDKSERQFKKLYRQGARGGDFARAIDQAVKDDFLMGKNDKGKRYLTPEYITRSDKFNNYLSLAEESDGGEG